MILNLADEEGKVFINPAHVLYVGPIEDEVSLVMLNGGQGFMVAEPFDRVVSLWSGSGLI